LVVHPDFQGIGIGTRFQEAVAKKVYDEGFVVICITTTPALVKALIKNKNWILYRYGSSKSTYAKATQKVYGTGSFAHLANKKSDKRITFSFCYKGRKKPLPHRLK